LDRIAQKWEEHPANDHTLDVLALQVGLSGRTAAWLFVREDRLDLRSVAAAAPAERYGISGNRR